MTYWPVSALLFIASLVAACSDVSEEKGRYALPPTLLEVSGLAAASDTSVFAHDDELAIVHELSVTDGKALRVFSLGKRGVRGDFEGIATANGSVYLVTSAGLIYAARIGEDGENVDYREYDTGVGERCEIEGLSRAPSAGHLLLLCKQSYKDKDRTRLEIYEWKIGTEAGDMDPWLSVPMDDLLKKRERSNFAPSGLEWDPERRRLLVVSARSRQMFIFNETGALLDKQKLDKNRHPQTEGITLLGSGLGDDQIFLADEGGRTHKAYLTAHQQR